VVVAEALDRLSRDQEDVAALYKRLSFAGVRIVTIAEDEVTDLHVGLKGTMNALYLKDLAQKTRRGLEGRIRQGKSAGGTLLRLRHRQGIRCRRPTNPGPATDQQGQGEDCSLDR
jgi:DNA invertase Pin-like site-specific DNA recombinase